jgi:hypothetical protein
MRNVTRPVVGPLLVAALVATAITMAGAFTAPLLLAGKARGAVAPPARPALVHALLQIEKCPIEVVPGGSSVPHLVSFATGGAQEKAFVWISSETGYECPYFRQQA